MISYFKELLCCLWEIEKNLHAIASSIKVPKKDLYDVFGNKIKD
ncbi:hypothetical protein [Fructilactobacillus lindneri]|nr:hypothetical protein [Fructilactobacillus lindneri]